MGRFYVFYVQSIKRNGMWHGLSCTTSRSYSPAMVLGFVQGAILICEYNFCLGLIHKLLMIKFTDIFMS